MPQNPSRAPVSQSVMVPVEAETPAPPRTAPDNEQSGILPLTHILEIVLRDTPGEILEVERDDDDGIEIYEIQILTPDDRKMEIKVNARTGAIIEKEED